MSETIKYKFGTGDYHNKFIIAESLEEAVNEFMLSCIDFSEFAYKNNPLSRSLLDEPIGYTKGEKNVDFPLYQFYELIPVWKDGELVKEISITEFSNWHLRQNNILEDKSIQTDSGDSGGVTASSMVHIKQNILNTSMKIRQIKLNMALERKNTLLTANDRLSEMQNQMSKIEEEYTVLQKKMDVLRTYSGIGRDIVKIRGGQKSDKLKIDIFQSFRYMKEDIDILTDFEGFDARDLESFDEFVADHYKELLPSEKCIQAFKVTKTEIKYSDPFMQQHMDRENSKVYIIIRNGDNVYRVFNDYNLHKDKLFVFDEPTEVFGNLAKELLETKSFNDEYENIKSSYDAKISGGESKGTHSHRISMKAYGYACEVLLDYNEALLDTLQKEADEKYITELRKREEYITKYDLADELDIYSWRWGTSLGRYRRDCNDKLLEVRHRMEMLEAYKRNDYLTVYGLLETPINKYGYYNNINSLEDLIPHENGVAYTDYETYRDTKNKNDFSDKFDPITAEPQRFNALWYDYDKYKDEALAIAREKVEEKFNEQNYKNFNSIAILQNILDSTIIFQDLPAVDVIFGKGIELLNFINDGSNLIDHNSAFDSPFMDHNDLKKGDSVFVIRREGNQITRYTRYEKKELGYFDRPQVILGKVTSIKNGEVRLKGYFDVYKNYNYDKGINAGDAKISIETLDNHWTLVSGNITEEDILKVLKNRHFRETFYETKGLALKDILKLKREDKPYNFGGGVRYERY